MRGLSKDVYVLSHQDLVKMLTLAYGDGMNKNSLETSLIINEVV